MTISWPLTFFLTNNVYNDRLHCTNITSQLALILFSTLALEGWRLQKETPGLIFHLGRVKATV